MKREIEFRGIYPHSGTFFYGDLVTHFPETVRIVAENSSTPVLIETVGQYINLTDKTGVKIFEDDICTKMISPDENNLAPKELYRGIVVYHFGGFCLKVGDYYYPMSRTSPVIHVIGNIHQTPELLLPQPHAK